MQTPMSDAEVLPDHNNADVSMFYSGLQTSEGPSAAPSSLGSPVHAAAVNGDRSALMKLITGQ